MTAALILILYYNPNDPYDMVWVRAAQRDLAARNYPQPYTPNSFKIEFVVAEQLGYRFPTKYQPFVPLSRHKAPYPTFWIRLYNYHVQDWTWEDDEALYEKNLKEERDRRCNVSYSYGGYGYTEDGEMVILPAIADRPRRKLTHPLSYMVIGN